MVLLVGIQLRLFRGGTQLTPILFLGDDALERLELIMRNPRLLGANGWSSLLHGLGGLHHLATELDDRQVARTETIMGSIGNRAHRFPHRDILIGDALDTGEAGTELHDATILPVVVFTGTEFTVVRVHIDPDLRAEELAPGLGIRRSARVAPGDEVERRMGVIDWHMQDRDIIEIVRWDLYCIGRDERT